MGWTGNRTHDLGGDITLATATLTALVTGWTVQEKQEFEKFYVQFQVKLLAICA
jgi:hypothetical protein